MMASIPKILIVDDEKLICHSARAMLSTEKYEIHTAQSGKKALEYLERKDFDLILLDIFMPDLHGFQVMEHILENKLNTSVIIMTAHATTDSAVEALRKGAFNYIQKPLGREVLLHNVKKALEQRKLDYEKKSAEEALKEAHNRLEKIVKERTEQLKRTNEKLRDEIEIRKRAEEKYKVLVESANEAILLSQEGRIRFINQRAMDFMGYSEEEMKSFNMMDFIHPHDRERAAALYLSRIKEEKILPINNYRVIDKMGETKWVQSSSTLMTWEGKPAVLTFLVDITDQKRAEEELEYRFNFEHLITTITSQFIYLDHRNVDKGINNALKMIGEFASIDRSNLFQFSNDLKTFSCTHEWSAENIEPKIQHIQKIPVENYPWSMKKHLQGEIVYIPRLGDLPRVAGAEKKEFEKRGIKSMLCVPMVCAGKIIGFMGFDSLKKEKDWPEDILTLHKLVGQILANVLVSKRSEMALHQAYNSMEERVKERTNELAEANEMLKKEIDERKQKEEELNQAKISAESANRTKSEFLANMSHELRTPLNHIIGFTELIADRNFGDINETQEEYLNDVIHSSKHLLSLIDDILDLSKVESGKLELDYSDVNITGLLKNSLIMVKEKAIKHGVQISLNLDGISQTIMADERKLKQILYNLLSNAVKFTPVGGSISLSANKAVFTGGRLIRDDGSELPIQWKGEPMTITNGNFIEVSVNDTGIGIKSEDLDRIFRPFEQADSSRNKQFQGTGLGLSLTRRLVELHGGKIWAESEGIEQGSTFSFIIPL